MITDEMSDGIEIILRQLQEARSEKAVVQRELQELEKKRNCLTDRCNKLKGHIATILSLRPGESLALNLPGYHRVFVSAAPMYMLVNIIPKASNPPAPAVKV